MSEERRVALEAAIADDLRLARALRQAALPAWLDLELPACQLQVLVAIATREPLSVSDVAVRTKSSRPTASTLVEYLVRRGLVTRVDDPSDRRRCLLGLTPAGRALHERLERGDATSLSQWFSRLEDAELSALVRGLRALIAAGSQAAAGSSAYLADASALATELVGASSDVTATSPTL